MGELIRPALDKKGIGTSLLVLILRSRVNAPVSGSYDLVRSELSIRQRKAKVLR